MLRDKERVDRILELLRRIWKRNNQLRLGQLLLNVSYNDDIYYLEDDELIERLEKLYFRFPDE